MRTSRMRTGAAIAAVGVAGLAGVGCGSDESGSGSGEGEPVEVAALLEQSGPLAATAAAFQHGLELATKESPGVIKVKYYDTASDPATGVQRYQQATKRDGHKFIFGPIYTPISLAIYERAEEDGTLMFTPGSSAPVLSDPPKRFVFTLMPTTALHVAAELDLLESMDAKRIGVITGTDAFGEDNLKAIREEAEARGIELAAIENMGVEATDASAQVSAMREANVDAVVVGAIPAMTSVLLQEAQKQELAAPLVNTLNATFPALTKQAMQRDTPDFYATTALACPLDPALVGDCAKSFVEDFKASFGTIPSVVDAIGYVGAKAFIEAVERADSGDPEEVAKALEAGEFESELMPGIRWTPDTRLGASELSVEGIIDGKLSFFGQRIDENTLKSDTP
jgi:branched-chain amino acid transport system substrate-binding protein